MQKQRVVGAGAPSSATGRTGVELPRRRLLGGLARSPVVPVRILCTPHGGPKTTALRQFASATPNSSTPGTLAESSWGDFSRAVLARPSLLLQWLRLPVLAGLALGLFAVTRAAFGSKETV